MSGRSTCEKVCYMPIANIEVKLMHGMIAFGTNYTLYPPQDFGECVSIQYYMYISQSVSV